MTRFPLRRTVASFLFLLLSLTALAAAAPVRPTPGGPAAGLLKSQPILSFLWRQMTRLWKKEGGSLDPSGKPQAGGSLDPSGLLSDTGGSLDPNGAK